MQFGESMKLVKFNKMCLSETCRIICKHFSDNFPIQSGSKQRKALQPPFLNFTVEYAIRKVHDNKVRPKLNGTHQLLASADDVNLLGDNVDTINRNRKIVFDISKEIGLQTKVEKNKHTLLSHRQNAGQIWFIKKHQTDCLKKCHSSSIWE
jgi:hypothetical protein